MIIITTSTSNKGDMFLEIECSNFNEKSQEAKEAAVKRQQFLQDVAEAAREQTIERILKNRKRQLKMQIKKKIQKRIDKKLEQVKFKS